MAFENPELPDVTLTGDIGEEQAPLVPPTDAYIAPDAIQTAPELEDAGFDIEEWAEAPWMALQIHQVGDAIYYGDHPDAASRAHIERCNRRHLERRQYVTDFVAEAPNLNGQYVAEMELATAQIAADFGEDVANTPFYLLAPKEFKVVNQLVGGGTNLGLCEDGRIFICVDPKLVERAGTDPLITYRFHEAGHAAAGDADYVTTFPKPDGKCAFIMRNSGKQSEYVRDATTKRIVLRNEFWEEGYAENYRVRAMAAIGKTAVAYKGKASALWRRVPDGTGVRFVTGEAGAPHFDPGKEELSLPWKFATYIGDTSWGSVPEVLAAYGIELLDRRLPGLLNQLDASRTDVDMKPRIIKRVNSVQPGLYEQIGRLSTSLDDLLAGLYAIEEALGILNDPVGE